ncbi:isoprenylcysteine carboxylmethyltransferase family protein [Leptothoe sp. EHU-05/26/07-4]
MNNNETTDGAAVLVPPPILHLVVAAVGIALNAFIWPLPFAFSGSIRLAIALAIAVPSIVLVAGALRLFWATGQDPEPWATTPEIVQTGVYRFTRNPMYLSLALLQVAIGIGLGNLWVVLLVAFSCLIVQITAIRPEEAYLEGKFGSEYLDYKESVRRWL